MPQDVNPRPHLSRPSRASDARLHHLLCHGRAVTVENYALTPEVTMLLQRLGQPLGQGHVPHTPSLR